MEPVVSLDAAGRRRSAATMPGHRCGQAPRNKGVRYPADPPSVEEIAPVMRHAGDRVHGLRLRGRIVVMWRAGLRTSEALALTESDPDEARGAILVRHGKGNKRREVGMDQWGWVLLRPRVAYRTLRLPSPRWWRCPCSAHQTRTFSPLASLIRERATPELRYLEAKFAGLISYGLSAKLLADILPLGRPLHATAVRLHAQAVAQRLEDELGDERWSFIDGCPATWKDLPRPDLPLVVGRDGGYVHSSEQRSRRDGWFEVIAGKSMPDHGPAKSFGFVQTYDAKPKRRLFDVLAGQGMQANQHVTFITDGGEDIRDLPLYLNPEAEHLLDGFHVTMRITVMTNMAKGLRSPPPDPDLPRSPPIDIAARACEELQRVKWFLWHGNVLRAKRVIDDLGIDLDIENPRPEQRKLLKALSEFATYIRANAGCIPNYDERYRAGEPISSSFAESTTINHVVSKRMVKKQQMRWSPRGAHLLLQIRTRVLNNDLADDFHRWYPGFTHTPPQEKIAV